MVFKLAKFKKNPKLIFHYPFHILILPYFLLLAFIRRLYSPKQTIYLIETYIKDSLLKYDLPDELILKRISIFNEVESFIKYRIQESGLSEDYLSEVKRRFERGDYMFILLNNKQPISFVFISEKKAYFNQVNHVEILPVDCFAVYDVYTYKFFRGKGYYSLLLSNVLKVLKNKGFVRFWLWVMKHNSISVQVHDKLNVNNVIAYYVEYYRFGFRFFKKVECSFKLSELFS